MPSLPPRPCRRGRVPGRDEGLRLNLDNDEQLLRTSLNMASNNRDDLQPLLEAARA